MTDTLAFDFDRSVCLFGMAFESEANKTDKKGRSAHSTTDSVLRAIVGHEFMEADRGPEAEDPYFSGESLDLVAPVKTTSRRYASPMENMDAFRQRGRGDPRAVMPDEVM